MVYFKYFDNFWVLLNVSFYKNIGIYKLELDIKRHKLDVNKGLWPILHVIKYH